MESPEDRRIHLVLKGRAATDPELRQAILDARKSGRHITVSVTWEGGDATRFAKHAVEEGARTVVAAGGDGTVNEVVRGVLDAQANAASDQPGCSVGVIPMGTANDFARAARIPEDDAVSALELILAGTPTPIDVGMVNGRAFVNVASGGVGAQIVAQTPAELKERIGGVSYSLTGLASILTIEPRRLSVISDEFQWEGESFIFTSANARTAGGGYCVAPSALLNDGLLDVMIVPRVAADELFRYVGQLLELNGDDEFHEIVRFKTSRLTMQADGEFPLNVDGEPMSADTFDFQVLPKRLPFHLTAAAPLTGD